MTVESRFIFGWVITYDSFLQWCKKKHIDLDDYLSDPEEFRDVIPSYINIQLICPYTNAPLHDYKCSIHINYCTGSLESFKTLPVLLLYGAIEFIQQIDPACGDPTCKAILHYT